MYRPCKSRFELLGISQKRPQTTPPRCNVQRERQGTHNNQSRCTYRLSSVEIDDGIKPVTPGIVHQPVCCSCSTLMNLCPKFAIERHYKPQARRQVLPIIRLLLENCLVDGNQASDACTCDHARIAAIDADIHGADCVLLE